MTDESPVSRPERRRFVDVARALGRPKVGLMLALGFSSGLPFMLIGNTLGFWLAEDGVKLALIGFLSWITLTYSVKFLWGTVVDRFRAPLIGFLGRRRGWMVVTQVGVGVGLIGMAMADPRAHLGWLTAFGLITGVAASAQDTVIDAWRIEIADDADELGLLTSAYSLGFRAALIATEALILLLAAAIGWPMSYAIYGGLMVVGVAAALLAAEPDKADQVMEAKAGVARAHPARAFYDAVVGPFVAFFGTHGWAMAALMLTMISFYHLCDYMRGPMTNPYYLALHIPKTTIAGVRATIGLGGSIAGIAVGGLASLRLGNVRTLILGAILQPIAIGAFAVLGWHGGDYTLISIAGLHVDADQPRIYGDAVRPADVGADLDRKDAEGLLRRDRGKPAAWADPAGSLFAVLPLQRRARRPGDPAVRDPGDAPADPRGGRRGLTSAVHAIDVRDLHVAARVVGDAPFQVASWWRRGWGFKHGARGEEGRSRSRTRRRAINCASRPVAVAGEVRCMAGNPARREWPGPGGKPTVNFDPKRTLRDARSFVPTACFPCHGPVFPLSPAKAGAQAFFVSCRSSSTCSRANETARSTSATPTTSSAG
jgi:PAT family beta-lactamase induction signal transducer AmpG